MKLTGSPRLLAIAGCLALGACGMKGNAEKAVREGLKDPDSAKFGAFYYNSTTKKGCLTVNAKNSMGGYVGDKQAHLTRVDKDWDIVFPEYEEGPDSCRTDFADKAS